MRRIIAKTRGLGLPEDEQFRALRRRGGTRPWHAVGCVAALVAFFIALVVTLSMGAD